MSTFRKYVTPQKKENSNCYYISLVLLLLLFLPFISRLMIAGKALRYCKLCEDKFIARSVNINGDFFYIRTINPREESVRSASLMRNGFYQGHVFDTFLKIFQSNNENRTDYYVVDIGSNLGFFSLLSAYFGYNTISYEIQSKLIQLFKSSIYLNDFNHLIQVKRKAISNLTNQTLIIPRKDYTKNTGGRGVIDLEHSETIHTTTIDSEINKSMKILILKIDIETHQKDHVIEGGAELFKSNQVENLIVEVNSFHYSSLKKLYDYGWNYIYVLNEVGMFQSWFEYSSEPNYFEKDIKNFLKYSKEEDRKLDIWLRKSPFPN